MEADLSLSPPSTGSQDTLMNKMPHDMEEAAIKRGRYFSPSSSFIEGRNRANEVFYFCKREEK